MAIIMLIALNCTMGVEFTLNQTSASIGCVLPSTNNLLVSKLTAS